MNIQNSHFAISEFYYLTDKNFDSKSSLEKIYKDAWEVLEEDEFVSSGRFFTYIPVAPSRLMERRKELHTRTISDINHSVFVEPIAEFKMAYDSLSTFSRKILDEQRNSIRKLWQGLSIRELALISDKILVKTL